MGDDGPSTLGERRAHPDAGTASSVTTAPAEPLATVRVRSLRWGERLKNAAWMTYGGGTLAFCAAMLVGQTLFAGHDPPLPIAFTILGSLALAVVSPFLTAAGLIAGRWRNLGSASVGVERGTLGITSAGEHIAIGPHELRQGAVRPGGVLVVEDRRGRELTLEVGEDRASQLLDALDLEPEKRRFVFAWERTGARVMGYLVGLVASIAVLSVPISALEHTHAMGAYSCLLFTAPWVVAHLLSRWMARRELAVGLDGIDDKSRRGRTLLRFADIDEVRDVGTELEVKTRDGEVHRLLADPADPAIAHAIRERIREAWALARARAGKGTIASTLLERSGQSMGDWRKSVAKILTAAAGFRGAAISSAELSEVMDDVTAPPEQRLAAAIALGSDPASRPRIRVAAEASVSPRLRVALEQLADGAADDDVLEAALAEQRR